MSRTFSTTFSGVRQAIHAWPADCFIQGGDDGIVFQGGGLEKALTDPLAAVEVIAGALGAEVAASHYRTAFFEAFPKSPSTFLRGEGKTLEEAEEQCWAHWQKILACGTHEYERGSYRTGAGICRRCGLFTSGAFSTTLEPCVCCGRDDNKASYGTDRHDRWHCEKCYHAIPAGDKSEMHKRADRQKDC